MSNVAIHQLETKTVSDHAALLKLYIMVPYIKVMAV